MNFRVKYRTTHSKFENLSLSAALTQFVKYISVYTSPSRDALISIYIIVFFLYGIACFYQNRGGGIKSHSVTALVYVMEILFLSPLAIGQRPVVIACCPSCIRLAVRACVGRSIRPSMC